MPEKPSEVSQQQPVDDIPAALRDTPVVKHQHQLKPVVLIGSVVAVAAIIFIAGFLLGRPAPKSQGSSSSQAGSTSLAATTNSPIPADNVLGHLPYKEAPASELETIAGNGSFKLRKAAAKQYKAMVAAARQSGVILVPISGFRSVAEQKHVFFDVKAQRGQDTKERAEVSAPPGYSEHHTGYAIDIGDSKAPATNLKPTFENTAAFKWLQKNATRFSFELSFPRDNRQGISYEPWHWRFVGDSDSLETFYKAKNLLVKKPSPDKTPESKANTQN
jgi:D-alanyl-D-alanine carboxypeptidase